MMTISRSAAGEQMEGPYPARFPSSSVGRDIPASARFPAAEPSSTLICGDAIVALLAMPAGIAELVYLDPPFFTGQRWQGTAGAFDDRWASLDEYVAAMRDLAEASWRALTSAGLLYLHCDDHASHYLRLMLDVVFDTGAGGFVSDIKWKRSSGASERRRGFTRGHDNILVFAKGDEWTFTDAGYDDLWLDIPPLNQAAKERVGYPTQKPVALLERIVNASSNPGDVVLDPCCGSGTTLVAARNCGRRSIGIDRSPDAIACAAARLSYPRRPVAEQLDLLAGSS